MGLKSAVFLFSSVTLLHLNVVNTESVRLLSSGYGSAYNMYDLETETGSLEAVPGYQPQQVDEKISWVEFDSGTGLMYAVHEVTSFSNGELDYPDSGVVSRWAIMDDSLTFQQMEICPTMRIGPTHLGLSFENRLLVTANYDGSSISAFALIGDDYAIESEPFYVEDFGEGSNVVPDRQELAHPHGAYFYAENQFMLVCDLGTDAIYIYQVSVNSNGNPSILRIPFDVDVGPGTGPRHAIVDEQNGLVYVLCELQPIVKVYSFDPGNGRLTEVASVDYELPGADPDQEQKGAELALHPTLPVLYATNRGFESILVFDVLDAAEGYLKQREGDEGLVQLEGETHRYLMVTPDGSSLLTAAQNSDNIKTFTIDPADGSIQPVDTVDSANQPTILAIVR